MQNGFHCHVCISVNTVVLLFHKGFCSTTYLLKLKSKQIKEAFYLWIAKEEIGMQQPCTVNCKVYSRQDSGEYVGKCWEMLGDVLPQLLVHCCQFSKDQLRTEMPEHCITLYIGTST